MYILLSSSVKMNLKFFSCLQKFRDVLSLFKIILNYGLKGSRWRIVKTADSTFGWKPVLGILGMDLDKFVSL